MDATRYRRAYFALVKSLELDDDERHGLNLRLTRHENTTDFTEADWRVVVAELQRLSGRKGVEDARPHLRTRHSPLATRHSAPYPLDSAATPEQVVLIEDLAREITWRESDGFRRFVAKTCFTDADEVYRRAWIDANAGLRSLPRHIASRVIRRLQRELHYQGLRSRAAGPSPSHEAARPSAEAVSQEAPTRG